MRLSIKIGTIPLLLTVWQAIQSVFHKLNGGIFLANWLKLSDDQDTW
jgi:hypothetical protein